MNRLLSPADFDVPACVTHFYQNGKRWFWHCLTDDTGSGKRRVHLRGHASAHDAEEGARDHRQAKYRNRQAQAYLVWWYQELMTTADPEFFVALWKQRHGDIGATLSAEELMTAVQSDNRLVSLSQH